MALLNGMDENPKISISLIHPDRSVGVWALAKLAAWEPPSVAE
jgi:hypothetical protein